MSPRTLWTIILKIFGIYILLQILYTLPQLFIFILTIKDQQAINALQEISTMLFFISVYLFMLIAFLFRTDWLINILKLEKSFNDEKLEINIHRSTVLKIAVIFSGIMLFAESLPALLRGLFAYYQDINSYNGFKRYPEGGMIVFNLAKVFISYFMMTSSRLIVNFIEHKRKGKVKVEEIKT
jgi:hypothetical protein